MVTESVIYEHSLYIKVNENSPTNTGTRPNVGKQCHGDLFNISKY